MKSLIKQIKLITTCKYFLSFVLLFISKIALFGQNSSQKANQLLSEITNGVTGIGNSLVSLLQAVLGLTGIIMLVVAGVHFMKGDREASQKLTYWGAGLIIVLILMSIVKAVLLK